MNLYKRKYVQIFRKRQISFQCSRKDSVVVVNIIEKLVHLVQLVKFMKTSPFQNGEIFPIKQTILSYAYCVLG